MLVSGNSSNILLLTQTNVLYMFCFLFVNRKHLLAQSFPLKGYFPILWAQITTKFFISEKSKDPKGHSLYLFSSFCTSRLSFSFMSAVYLLKNRKDGIKVSVHFLKLVLRIMYFEIHLNLNRHSIKTVFQNMKTKT